MNKPPAFQFYANDFLGGTQHLTDAEVGLYIRLLLAQWSAGSLPNDDEELLSYGKSTALSTTRLDRVKAKFELCPDGRLRNARLEREREKQNEFRLQRSFAGKQSAQVRSAFRAAARSVARDASSTSVEHPFNERSNGEATPNSTKTERPIEIVTTVEQPLNIRSTSVEETQQPLNERSTSVQRDGQREVNSPSPSPSPSPDNTKYNSKPPISPEGTDSGEPTPFDKFWEAYPVKVGKLKAMASFNKAMKATTLEVILAAVELAKKSDQWNREGGRFIPHPTTWLNQGRWDDQITPDAPGRSDADYQKEF